jgi:hypothetical protein
VADQAREREHNPVERALDGAAHAVAPRGRRQPEDAECDPEGDPPGRPGPEPAARDDHRAAGEEHDQIGDEARAHWPLLSVLMCVCIWGDVRV